MPSQPNKPQALSIFKLVMMAVVAIDSLKNLPSNAQYGMALIFYYLLAVMIFFIPCALITAELASSLPISGGSYQWVKKAFGKGHAFITAWMQWLIMIVWSPTILSFTVSTLFYLFAPHLTDNRLVMFSTVTGIFWLGLWLVSRGIKVSSRVSTVSAIVGVILPMSCISLLGAIWLWQGHGSHITFNLHSDTQPFFSREHLRLLIPILYSLMGIEMIAVHAEDVKNPQRNYPLVLIIASLIIIGSVIPASLAIAVVTPQNEISLTLGIIQSFNLFLHAFNLSPWLFLMVIAIAIGSFGIFYNWLLTVSRYLLCAAEDGSLPHFMQTKNKYGMPSQQMLLQGCIATVVSGIFVLMPSVNYAFWLLSVSCAQFGLMYYVYLFSAAIYLRFKYPEMERPFRVGNGNGWIISMSVIAMMACLIAIGFGFIPPAEMDKSYIFSYELSLVIIMVGGLILGGFIYYYNQLMVKLKPYKINHSGDLSSEASHL